jgi:hypothetical protein
MKRGTNQLNLEQGCRRQIARHDNNEERKLQMRLRREATCKGGKVYLRGRPKRSSRRGGGRVVEEGALRGGRG